MSSTAEAIRNAIQRIQPVCCDELMYMADWHPDDPAQRLFKCTTCGSTKSVQQCSDEAVIAPRH